MARASSGARDLFPTGPKLSLDDFSKKDFIAQEFVDQLAEYAIPLHRRSSVAQNEFDPKPYIRTFENVLSQLESLAEQVRQKESELESQVRKAEVSHDQTLKTLSHKLDQAIDSLEALDNTLNNPNSPVGLETSARSNPGGNIVLVGRTLEELDRQRRKALDARFLIECWVEVSRTGKLNSLWAIQREGGPENYARCAVISKQLLRISRDLNPSLWEQTSRITLSEATNENGGGNRGPDTREILEKFRETLEQDLLKQFNKSYRRQAFDDMRECAKVLQDFGDGASVIALFLNQHQFFIDKDEFSDEVTADGKMWEMMADPNEKPPGVEPSLQLLIDRVRSVMIEESFIIKRAFPYHETVLIKFIQRIFQQSIQQRLEMVLDKANTISPLAYLRSLRASKSYIESLVEDLKDHGLTENPESCSERVAKTLDAQLEELFVPYLDSNSYIEREQQCLEDLINSLLFKFTTYHSRRKAPTGFLASLVVQPVRQAMATAKDAYIERLQSSDLTPAQRLIMLHLPGLPQTSSNQTEIEVSESDGTLDVEKSQTIMKWLAESVGRTLDLGTHNDIARNMNVLLGLLLKTVGQVYILTALDEAHEHADSQKSSRTEPDLSYLPTIQSAVTIVLLMSRFISTLLIRVAQSNATVRLNMESRTKMEIDNIEKKANAVMSSTMDVAVNWVTKCLAGQKKLDFRPKDSELELMVGLQQTPTCLAICKFLDSGVVAKAVLAVDGDNLEEFKNQLAIEVQRLLFEHFKKFPVSASGGLMVTKDIAKYVSTMRAWQLGKDAAARVDILTEIGYLFTMGTEALRERLRNLNTGAYGGGNRILKADFMAFIQRRDDSSSVGIQSVLAGA